MLTPALKRLRAKLEKQGKKFASSRDLPAVRKSAGRKVVKKKKAAKKR
jgi:hypothetical protein